MDIYEAKYNELLEAVASARHYQIQSERYRCSQDRAKYLQWQRKVDNLIKAAKKEQDSKQTKLIP